MSDLPYVMKRIEAGAKVRFMEDFYGRQWVVVRRGWLPWPKRRVSLRNDEISQVREALVRRRTQRAAVLSPVTQ